MVKLRKVDVKEKDLVYNCLQKYLYEMTLYYEDEMDEKGNYEYDYFDSYFVDEDREVMFIEVEEKLVGFVMINNHSIVGEKIDYAIAEFTIFPMYRNKHYASDVMSILFENYKGKWEIKFSLKNEIGMRLWKKVVSKYNPKSYIVDEDEALVFDTRS